MTDWESLVNKSRAHHFGVEVELGGYFRNWTPWVACKPMCGLVDAPNKPGVFTLGRWVTQPGGSGYLILPFYFGEAENLASVVVPLVRYDHIMGAYNIIEDQGHRQTVIAALRKRQGLDAERDSVIGCPFPPVRDPEVFRQLPAVFPFS